MKKMLILLLFIASCKNKKAELVDIDRKYRDSARTYFDLAGMCIDDDFKSHPHKTELERLRTHDTSDAISKEVMSRCNDLVMKSSRFKVMADSIEWELKKY